MKLPWQAWSMHAFRCWLDFVAHVVQGVTMMLVLWLIIKAGMIRRAAFCGIWVFLINSSKAGPVCICLFASV
jgi:hypothetical protein